MDYDNLCFEALDYDIEIMRKVAKAYTICDLLTNPDFKWMCHWAKTCFDYGDIDQAESEWVFFQIDSEYVYGNIPGNEVRDIMKECERLFADEYDNSQSPVWNMQRFFAKGKHRLPDVAVTGSRHVPKYVNTLMTLDTFRKILFNTPKFVADVGRGNITRQFVIDNLSTEEAAELLSKKLENDQAKLGREIRSTRAYFWISDGTKLDSGTYFYMSEHNLSSLIEASGLPWCLGVDGTLHVVLVRIPSEHLKNLRVPTVFHSGISYFKPNEDAVNNWGRAVDKRTRTARSGLPELIHETIDWKTSFRPSYAGCLKEELIAFGESDWRKLLVNSWLER